MFDLGDAQFDTKAGWGGQTWSIEPGTVAAHPGVRSRSAVVVRPEDVGIARDRASVPAGANSVEATVRDLEYMGSYRTAMLALGASGQSGRARIDALDSTLALGDEVVAWWKPERQRIVAA